MRDDLLRFKFSIRYETAAYRTVSSTVGKAGRTHGHGNMAALAMGS
jgi:hypothetical protein